MNEQMKEYGDSVQECQGSDTECQARAQTQSLRPELALKIFAS